MAKQNVAEQETLGEAMNRTELFFEKNGRNMAYIFLGLLVLAALIFGYRALIVAPRATKAAERIAEELSRLLAAPKPGTYLEPAVLAVLFPELELEMLPEICRIISSHSKATPTVPASST